MPHRRVVAAGIAAALALVLGACGAADEAADSSAPAVGVLDELWETATADYLDSDAHAEQLRVEEHVAECMSGEGFEYTPVDYSALQGWMTDDDVPAVGTVEFAEQYGYGVTTGPWTDADGEWVDPNQAYVDAMSPATRSEYFAALYGVETESQEGSGPDDEAPPWEERGCSGWAEHEVYGDLLSEGSDDGDWASFEAELERLYEVLATEPAYVEAVLEWSSCMADAGYPGLVRIEDVEQAISDELDALYSGSGTFGGLGEDSDEADWAVATATLDEQVAALTAEEIETATADITCRNETGYQDVYDELNVRLQQEFYDAHRDEVEAYIEAMTTGRG